MSAGAALSKGRPHVTEGSLAPISEDGPGHPQDDPPLSTQPPVPLDVGVELGLGLPDSEYGGPES